MNKILVLCIFKKLWLRPLPLTDTETSERDGLKFSFGHIECELLLQGSSREDEYKTRYT